MGSNSLCTYNKLMFIILYLVLGGEVAEDQFNNYTGPIVIQDVECSGNASSLSECNVNTFITTECLSSSSIVRINCFFYSKFDLKYSIIGERAKRASHSLVCSIENHSIYAS